MAHRGDRYRILFILYYNVQQEEMIERESDKGKKEKKRQTERRRIVRKEAITSTE